MYVLDHIRTNINFFMASLCVAYPKCFISEMKDVQYMLTATDIINYFEYLQKLLKYGLFVDFVKDELILYIPKKRTLSNECVEYLTITSKTIISELKHIDPMNPTTEQALIIYNFIRWEALFRRPLLKFGYKTIIIDC